jgi:hypothetical protein
MYTQNTNLVYKLLGFKDANPSPNWFSSERYYNCDQFQSHEKHKKSKALHR